MATYRNSIVVTDISYNDLSGNKFIRGIRTLTDNSLLSARGKDAFFEKITFYDVGPPNEEIIGQAKFSYNVSVKSNQNGGFFYDVSGNFNTREIPGGTRNIILSVGQILIETSTGTKVGDFVITTSAQPNSIIISDTDDKQYIGFTYDIWDDLSNNIISNQFIGNFLYDENDDSGGPNFPSANPGFVPIAEPIQVVSQLTGAAGSARVRISGTNDPNSATFENDTIPGLNQPSGEEWYASNPNGGLWIGIDPEPALFNNDYLYTFFADSNCYHSKTILETENGPMCIKDIKRGMLVKTRNGFKKVVRVLSNGCKLRDFVVFEKGSLGENIPNQDLMITKGHPVYYQGKYLNSLEFVKNNFFDKIYIKRLETDGLHHIQFETHECVLTNNLWTTSLPHNMGNKIPEELYFDKSLYNPDDKGKHYPPYCLHVDPPNDELDDDDLEHISQFE